MLYRTKSGDYLASERMLMPAWAKNAARVLSDIQIESGQRESRFHTVAQSHGDWPAEISEDGRETVGGTVSRKGKFGFANPECCPWVPNKGGEPEFLRIRKWVPTIDKHGMVRTHTSIGLHWPERCKKCKARMKRWTNAANRYKQLDILRVLEGRANLKFVTKTRKDWSITIDFEDGWKLWEIADDLKKKAYRQARNWRSRNKYWTSRKAKGMIYPECKVTPVWPFDEVKLHFHMHMIVCSKRIENQDIQIDLNDLKEIPMSTTIQREWGGIVDVRKCRTWEHKDGEIKTSKRFVMNYLLDYINKAAHWQSSKFGDW